MDKITNKIDALAKYLDIDPQDIEQQDDTTFDYGSEEYVVATEEEAYDLANDSIISLIDDMGVLQTFTKTFLDYALPQCYDIDKINEVIDEEIDYFSVIEKDEENVEYLNSLTDDEKFDYLLNIFSDSKIDEFIDIDKLADLAIEQDGVAHFIAYYDGDEIDLGDGLYAYRIN